MSGDPSLLASDPAVSAWVAANAGSGKTYTLANRVARLLLAGAEPEKILCLTFTRAAAAEMQKRLFDEQLGKWAMMPDESLRAALAAIGAASDDLPRARRLFAQALETPGGLKVLTLHGFCQHVLSRFPLEAGVPPSFAVLDEQSAREMIGEARQRVLEQAGAGEEPLAGAVARLAVQAGEFRMAQVLDTALGGDRRRLDGLLAGGESPALLARRALGVTDGESSDEITDGFCSELSREIGQLKTAREWLAGGTATDARLGAILAGALSGEPEEQFSALYKFFFDSKNEKRAKLAMAGLQKSRPDLLDFLTALQERYCRAHDRRRAVRAADLAEAALTVVAAVRREYETAKRHAGVLDYDDLIVETANLLGRRGAAGWVLYKLDGGIDHVLIDEAQDTSPEQWDIVRKLTGEFFAGEGRAERKMPRTIFAVGDEKQSIFSFQGADPSQFETNRRYFEAMLADTGQSLLNRPLITSRRSAPQVLRFVDTVFATQEARDGLTFSGAAITHEAWRQAAPGGVEFWPALEPLPREETDPWLAVDAVQAESPVARLARQVADRIAGWISSGARLPGHDRPIAPKDIMILLPRRNPFGGEVIRQLKLRGVPVAGADRIRLTEQIAVMDLIALGRFALQREDDLNLAALLRSPLCGLSEQELETLAHDRARSLWGALAARRDAGPAMAAAHALLSDMLALADFAPPFEFYSQVLAARGGRERLLARLGGEVADAVEEFLALSLAYERSHSPSLEGFLDWIERGGAEIKRDMERGHDEVRVMTVHGAKGLEADIVILPDTTSQAGGLRRHEGLLYTADGALFPLARDQAPPEVEAAKQAADAEALREHRRLLYVALTRARDRLIVCGFKGKREIDGQSWYALTRAAAESLGMKAADDGGEALAFGTVAMERGEANAAPQDVIALPGWLRRPAPPESSPRPIRPSQAMEGPAFSPLGRGAARYRRGLVVHALLARLPEIAPEKRFKLACDFARRRGFAAAEAEALAKETLAVLDDPQFAAAFGPDSQAEAGLVADLPELGARINGRIDRLAVSDEEVLILDFKTNRPPPADEAGVAEITLGQMALYRAGAARLFPGRRIVCGLLFTDGPRLIRLSDAVLDRQWAKLAARLDPG